MTEQGGFVPETRDDRAPLSGERNPPAADSWCGQTAEDTDAAIASLRDRVEDLDRAWRLALADADNLRKRSARERQQVRAEEKADAARRWLTVVDNLDRALEHAQSDPSAIIEGIRAIRDQAVGILADLGFPRLDDLGEPFDPARHDAVDSRPGTGAPAGTVVEVVQPAYGTEQHQLRPAQVVVARDR